MPVACAIPAATHIVTGYLRVYVNSIDATAINQNTTQTLILATLNEGKQPVKSFVYSAETPLDFEDPNRTPWPVTFFLRVSEDYVQNRNGILDPIPSKEQLVLETDQTDSTPFHVSFFIGMRNAQYQVICTENGSAIISVKGYVNRPDLHTMVEPLP